MRDIPFLQLDDYMLNGQMKYEVFCPLTDTTNRKKLGKARAKKRTALTGEEEENAFQRLNSAWQA